MTRAYLPVLPDVAARHAGRDLTFRQHLRSIGAAVEE